MKKIVFIFIIMTFILTGCSKEKENVNEGDISMNKSAVVYFSATNNTKKVAEEISYKINADLIEIVPDVEYTKDDLNYNTDCRANREQNDDTSRPKIKNNIDVDKYDTLFIGYPIWWGTYPKIILTFVDSNNLDNKNIYLFCTSGSTGIETSVNDLKKYKPSLNIIDAKRFSLNYRDEVSSWLKTSEEYMYAKIGSNTLKIKLIKSSSTDELVKKLKENDLTITMSDYGNFEKVGDLPFSLSTNDQQISVDAGDVILYQGNKITIYYDTNSWNFTKLGNVVDLNKEEIKAILSGDKIEVTFSLND